MQCTRKSHILKWLLSYTPRTKKETVMGTLAFYELLDESAYIAVFLVTSRNIVWRGKFCIWKLKFLCLLFIIKPQSNLVIWNFLVIPKLFLNDKSSISLWSKLAFGHGKWFFNTNLILIKMFLITKFDCNYIWLTDKFCFFCQTNGPNWVTVGF